MLKLIFIGWNENGEKCLNRLIQNKHRVLQVFLPEGYEVDSMIKICKLHHIKFDYLKKDWESLRKKFSELKPDLLVVASFPFLMPEDILNLPKFGAINVHAGELPKYRGYHPINWAIIKDESCLGVTVHYIDEGMDSGNIIAQDTVNLTNRDDVNSMRRKLTDLGAKLVVRAVNKIDKSKGNFRGIEQRDNQVLFAPKRNEVDGKIKWTNRSRDIFNLIRALHNPCPNAFGFLNNEKVLFQKSYVPNNPGEVIGIIKGFYVVTTGDGVIMLKTNHKLNIGDKFTLK